jgi:formate dehydrogenase major subunit
VSIQFVRPHPTLSESLDPIGDFLVTVNGKSIEASPGELLIHVINRSGTEIPQICFHPQLGPIQTCDTCLVEVDGELMRACGTKVSGPTDIVTESARAREAQLDAFDRILHNHLLYCTVCDNNNGNCTVHNTTALLNVEHQQRPFVLKPYEKDFSNPFYRYDPDQCILCGRCVEACQNVQVNETLSIRWEDEHPRVLWDGGEQIAGSSCVSCGHCITVCPCNALMEKSMLGEAGFFTGLPNAAVHPMIDFVKGVEPEVGYGVILQLSEFEASMREKRIKRTKTVCTYCGVGCSFDIWTKDRNILKVEPEQGPANGISTCVKGKFAWDYVNSPERIKKPLIREGERFREASWEEALDLVATKFAEYKRDYGPDSLAFIASSKCTNEESFLMQKLARAVIGTNNIDNCSRYCQTPATTGLTRTVGYGGDSGSIKDIENAGLVIIIGSNTAEAHPVIAARIKAAHKLRGQKLFVFDLRKHEMARRADLFVRPKPSTDMVWLSAVTKYIIDNDLHKPDFINEWVNGFDQYRKSLEPFTLEFAERTTGISAEMLKTVAHEIANASGVCIIWAMGVTQHCGGSDTSTAISNLLLATGNYKRTGTGAYPMRGHNNVQGASDFGSMPAYFPGYQKSDDPKIIEKFEQGWGVQLSRNKGLDNHQMVDAIHEGKLKSILLAGEDMFTSDSNANYVGEALTKLDFFVVQELFLTKTAEFANVILPGAASLEKEGTFTNTERRIQRLYQALEPLGETRPDWAVLQDIANRLGAGWNYRHPSDIMDEAARLCPIFAGVNYQRLEGYKSLQWPVAVDGTDEPLLYTKSFPFPDGKAKFHPLEWIPPCEEANSEYDLHLNNGRVLEHFEVGNMTYRVKGIREETPDTFVEVSPELAAERGIEDGSYLEIRSRHGWVRVRAIVSDRVQGNELYMAMNTLDYPVNRLTSSNTDRTTHTPAYKEAAVQIRVLEKRETPLPPQNFRYGHPTPQNGVEVERKWKQRGYRMPGNPLVQIQTKERLETREHPEPL